jgi:hypothetical protein
MDESDPSAKLMNILRGYAVFSPNTMMLRGLVTDPHARVPVRLSGGRLPETVRELKQRAETNQEKSASADAKEACAQADRFEKVRKLVL